MLTIGVVFILLSIVLSGKIPEIISQIITIVGSFSVWESANSWLVNRRSIKAKKIKLLRLKKIEIFFN